MLPLLLLAAGLAYDNAQTIRQAEDDDARLTAINFAASVDLMLRTTVNALSTIAQSSHLDDIEQWPQLYTEAKVLHATLGTDVVVMDAFAPYQMRLNTLAPFGAELPARPTSEGFETVPEALATLQPTVGDRLTSPVNQRLVTEVVVPAIRNGRASYALVSPVDTEKLQHLLDDFTLPAGWHMTLSDSKGEILARTVQTDNDAPPDSDPPHRHEVKSSLSGWRVLVNVPNATGFPITWASGGALALLVLAAAMVGAVIGSAGGRRLSKAVASLSQGGPDQAQLAIKEVLEVKSLLAAAADRERISEARFRRLFRDAPLGMGLIDQQGNIVAQNAAYEAIFGYTFEEAPTLEQWRKRAFPDPVERSLVEQSWADIIATKPSQPGKIPSTVLTITAKGGAKRKVQVYANLLDDAVLSTFIDITEQSENEASLRLWAEAFEHAELNLSISDSRTNTLRVVNPAFARLHGYERSEMTGMPIAQLIPPGGSDTVKESFERWSGASHMVLESLNIRKDGSCFPVQLDVTVLHDANGTPISRLVYATDLTERKRTEAEIEALQANLEQRVIERTTQLSQANQELDAFAYTVSHDLRAPLRAMDGFLHLLREEHGDLLPQNAQQHLDKINAAIVRMKNLIEGILTLTHSARHDLQLTTVNLSELVRKHLNELASAEPDHPVHVEVQPDLLTVGDGRMLEVVMSNLVSNAWKYTAKTSAPSIRFYAENTDGKTWFCLADNGAGFDANHAGKLFQPFQRMHRHDEFPGIGIGLATVQRIVLRHGGRIEAVSRPGQGALFRFTLNTDRSESRPES